MKIFGLFSSPNGEKSQGYRLLQKLIEEIENNHGKISEVNCFHTNNLQILPSNGNQNIFINGLDPLDKIDHFDFVKKKLEEADLIILGSPVYAQNVSAHMKIFMERISHYAHNFGLIGKLSYIVTTSYSNGNDQVHDYLKSCLDYMGVISIGRSDLVERFNTSEMVEQSLRDAAKKIVQMFNDPSFIPINSENEKIYSNMCKLYQKFGNEKRYQNEFQTYEERGLFDVNSFKEIFLSNFKREGK